MVKKFLQFSNSEFFFSISDEKMEDNKDQKIAPLNQDHPIGKSIQRDRETERQRDRETERQRDRETEGQRDRDFFRSMNMFFSSFCLLISFPFIRGCTLLIITIKYHLSPPKKNPKSRYYDSCV